MRTRWSTGAVLATVAALVVAAPAAASGTSTAREHRARVIATFGTAESFAESATLDVRGNAVVSVTHWTEGLGRLYVVSDVGDSAVADITALDRPRCELAQALAHETPVLWKGDRLVRSGPSNARDCGRADQGGHPKR